MCAGNYSKRGRTVGAGAEKVKEYLAGIQEAEKPEKQKDRRNRKTGKAEKPEEQKN